MRKDVVGRAHAADKGDLLVRVIPVERFEVHLQLVAEEAVLRAERVCRESFRREGVFGRCGDEEATRFEPCRDVRIDE